MGWTDPDLGDFTGGEEVTASKLDTYVKDNLSWLGIDRPHGRAIDTDFDHGTENTWISPTYDTVGLDGTPNVQGGFSSGTAVFSAPAAGFYLIGGTINWTANGTGARAIMISSQGNGGGIIYAQNYAPPQSASVAMSVSVSTCVQLGFASEVAISGFQKSGSALNNNSANMWAIWMCV